MKMFKRVISVLLMVMMAVVCMPMIPGVNGRVNAVSDGWIQFGTCEYQLTGDGNNKTLTIRPENNGTSGTMPTNIKSSTKFWPWDNERANITKIDIAKGVEAGTSVYDMFYGCTNLTEIKGLNNLDTSNVADMYGMFHDCKSLSSLDVSNLNTSKVGNMQGMFNGCSSLETLDVSNIDTSKVEVMTGMFAECSKLTSLDLSNFVLSEFYDGEMRPDTRGMFEGCSSLKTIYVSENFGICGNSSSMFWNCGNLVGGKGTRCDTPTEEDYTTDGTRARIDGGATNPGYFTRKTVNIAKTENGKLTVSNKGANTGETVTVTATPDEGYELNAITVTDKDAADITSTVLNGSTITMPADEKLPITVSATFKKKETPTPTPEKKDTTTTTTTTTTQSNTTDKSDVDTGDNNNLMSYFILFDLMLAGIAAVLYLRLRGQKK